MPNENFPKPKDPIVMHEVNDNCYRSESGYVMQREYGKTPNGNPLGGFWVLRGPDGDMIDYHQYSNDLASWYNLERVSLQGVKF